MSFYKSQKILVTSGPLEIVWDTSGPKGGEKRLTDMAPANSHGFSPRVSTEDAIKRTMQCCVGNMEQIETRYNAFKEKAMGGR